ncbi:MAG: DUF433 domain-containing protein [Acidimicrobiia bacterium]|nr:DUF433 domain-containing protein [Acidimicrobiia bacterium]
MGTKERADMADRLLGRGIYDLVETARLVRRDPDTIARWIRGKQPLYPVADTRFLSFLDVVSLLVVSELVERKVPKREIRAGADYLATKLKTSYPFAHEKLATAGAAFFGKVGDWVDVGKGGQGAFELVVRDLLRPIEYGSDQLAAVWRPRSGVWVNPAVQAGAPCIDGTRVPTRVIAELAEAEEDLEDIAEDLHLGVSEVEAALEYERAA